MKEICVIGLNHGSNLGDVIIHDCVIYMIQRICKELQVSDYKITSIDMMEEDYSFVHKADIIVFAGGGIIKYKYQKFYQYIDELLVIANNYNIPVIFNGVGVEGYDDNDDNCQRLKIALNQDCVKQITVRDDIDLLNQKYITNPSITTKKVADPAVWSSECYEITKNSRSQTIGLGVVREGIFRSNGIDIGLEELLLLWRDIIFSLEERKIPWEIFTTGWPSDMKFAINLMKFMGREHEIDSKVVPQMTDPIEMMKTIASYKGIIAGRLHGNIVGYALKVPAVGLIWNDKLAFWSHNIGYPHRYFRVDEFSGETMVKTCLQAIEEGYIEKKRLDYKNSAYDSLKNAFHRYIKIKDIKNRQQG